MYKHILLGIDLHPKCDKALLAKAAALAKLHGATLSVVHAVEHINSYGMVQAYPGVVNIEESLCSAAKEALSKLCVHSHVPESHQHVEMGSPKLVIADKVKALNADLVIVGAHGRHGLSFLMGSTASSVLGEADCDVLAIHLK